jgi:hypothetical protein
MNTIAEVTMILECNDLLKRRAPEAMAPLLAYLESDRTISPLLRTWLISLLRPPKGQPYYLTVKTRAGRPSIDNSKRDNQIVKRVAALDGAIVTDILCQALPAITDMSIVEPDVATPETHSYGWQERDDCGDWIPASLTLKIGTTMNRLQAQKIAAAESSASISTVKRVLVASNRAQYGDNTSSKSKLEGTSYACPLLPYKIFPFSSKIAILPKHPNPLPSDHVWRLL